LIYSFEISFVAFHSLRNIMFLIVFFYFITFRYSTGQCATVSIGADSILPGTPLLLPVPTSYRQVPTPYCQVPTPVNADIIPAVPSFFAQCDTVPSVTTSPFFPVHINGVFNFKKITIDLKFTNLISIL
jgi:hypothetical protein